VKLPLYFVSGLEKEKRGDSCPASWQRLLECYLQVAAQLEDFGVRSPINDIAVDEPPALEEMGVCQTILEVGDEEFDVGV